VSSFTNFQSFVIERNVLSLAAETKTLFVLFSTVPRIMYITDYDFMQVKKVCCVFFTEQEIANALTTFHNTRKPLCCPIEA
jgi:hypothetical protein